MGYIKVMAKASFKFSRSRTARPVKVDGLTVDPCTEEVWSACPDGVQLSLLIDVEDLYLGTVLRDASEDFTEETGTCAQVDAEDTSTQSSLYVVKSAIAA